MSSEDNHNHKPAPHISNAEDAALADRVQSRFGDALTGIDTCFDMPSFEITREALYETCLALRDEFGFEQCMDVCGVDYLAYGQDQWVTKSSTDTGFTRGADHTPWKISEKMPRRFAVVYHLLSIEHNARLRLRVYCDENQDPPIIPSVYAIWSGVNWFEREVFDLFGILFDGHPDMRRILTDYGFIGHPFRKDFPLIGNVEVRYDPERGRVVYQPVTIEPRTLVPKVIRKDHQDTEGFKESRDV